MQFTHTLDKVLSGEKTLTSRFVKLNQFYDPFFQQVYSLTLDRLPLPAHITARRRILWQVGKTYAVQPGRRKAGVARIRLLAIKRYDVRQISAEDVLAEGFQSRLEFLETWTAMHDHAAMFFPEDGHYSYWAGRTDKWVSVNAPRLYAMILARPIERYQAWQLRFELVK